MIPWIAILMMAAMMSAAQAAEPLILKCLEKRPVDVEVCFEEWIGRNPDDPGEWRAFVDALAKEIFLNQETRQFRIHEQRPKEEAYAYHLPPDVKPESNEALVLKEKHRYKEEPYLSSGGLINWLTLKPTLKGHSDVTREVLSAEPFGFVGRAAAIVADAAQDPDFYDWSTDAAHAQTPADDAGTPTDPIDFPNGVHAAPHFVDWVAAYVREARARCQANDARIALYWLGYGLHAVQDLAAHKGRASAEHSWDSFCNSQGCGKAESSVEDEQDPDELSSNIVTARDYTTRFFQLVHAAVDEPCWGKLKWYGGPRVLALEKRQALGRVWDFGPTALAKYRGQAKQFAQAGPGKERRVRWVGRMPGDEGALFDLLKARIQ